MKVLNYTTSYLAIILLILISIWASIFYYAMLDEIYDSIDDGLDNQKGLVLQKIATDSTLLKKSNFEESDYAIREIVSPIGRNVADIYIDTLMYMQNEEDFEPVRLLKTTFSYKSKHYQMEVITSMVEEDDLIAELLVTLIWLYVGLVAAILILNNFLLKRIWSSFYHLLKQLKKFRLENPSDIQVKSTRIDEFKLLNETIQKLLQTNINSYNSQKHFIENAAHELQTPLGVSINKLEALAETAKLKDDELKLLASALDNLERLTRLNKSLLLLSRIENKQFLSEQEININDLVKKIADDFSDQLNYSQLIIHIDEQFPLTIKMNRDLATILLTNLIKNAIVHNHPEGLINVSIQQTSLQIENTGREEALNQHKLFTRFNKEQQSEASTGLGLSIVKAIADLYGFKITYSYSNRHIIVINFQSLNSSATL